MWCLAPRRYLKLIQDGEKMVPVWMEPPGQSCLDPAGWVKTSFLTAGGKGCLSGPSAGE